MEACRPAPGQSGCFPRANLERAGGAAELDDFVRQAMEALLIPGVSIAMVQAGRLVYSGGFGIRKIGGSEAVTPSTRFRIGSTTKPLTSLLMARLIDQGRFAWSTPVCGLLPDFALADPEITRKLEMRHTMCACTGMPRRDVDFLFRFRGVSPEQRLAEMKTMRPTTAFGEVFQYSNLLVAAGGYAAARAYRPLARSPPPTTRPCTIWSSARSACATRSLGRKRLWPEKLPHRMPSTSTPAPSRSIR